MSQNEIHALKEQIALLQEQLLAQQEILEREARRRIVLEDAVAKLGTTTDVLSDIEPNPG